MKLKNRALIIDLLLIIAIYGIPLLILGACGVHPVGTPRGIIFYCIMGLSILAHLLWVVTIYKKDGYFEDAIFLKQLKLSFLVLLIPFINLIIYYIPMEEKWGIIVTVILDFLLYVGYFIMYSIYAHVQNKMGNALKTHQSERVEIRPTSTYETDDGDFKGSSARK